MPQYKGAYYHFAIIFAYQLSVQKKAIAQEIYRKYPYLEEEAFEYLVNYILEAIAFFNNAWGIKIIKNITMIGLSYS